MYVSSSFTQSMHSRAPWCGWTDRAAKSRWPHRPAATCIHASLPTGPVWRSTYATHRAGHLDLGPPAADHDTVDVHAGVGWLTGLELGWATAGVGITAGGASAQPLLAGGRWRGEQLNG